jgi:DNA-binding PadR family transcriptional regulator
MSFTEKALSPRSQATSAKLGLDPVVHEPARLIILLVLEAVETADFKFLALHTEQSPGNLSAQTIRLEQAGYISISKGFCGKYPATEYRLTAQGKAALNAYWQQMEGWQHSRQNLEKLKQQKASVRTGTDHAPDGCGS